MTDTAFEAEIRERLSVLHLRPLGQGTFSSEGEYSPLGVREEKPMDDEAIGRILTAREGREKWQPAMLRFSS